MDTQEGYIILDTRTREEYDESHIPVGMEQEMPRPRTRRQRAEGFAAGGVKLLSPLCDVLCFGAETANKDILLDFLRGKTE